MFGFRPSCASPLPQRPADKIDRTDGVGSCVDEVKLKHLFRESFKDFAHNGSKTHGAVVGIGQIMVKRHSVGTTAVVREFANRFAKDERVIKTRKLSLHHQR